MVLVFSGQFPLKFTQERILKQYKMARAIKRLYEVKGIENGKNNSSATVAEVAAEIGKSERTVSTLRTIADLIPELSAMLDAGEITQAVAYQFAQIKKAGVLVPALFPG